MPSLLFFSPVKLFAVSVDHCDHCFASLPQGFLLFCLLRLLRGLLPRSLLQAIFSYRSSFLFCGESPFHFRCQLSLAPRFISECWTNYKVKHSPWSLTLCSLIKVASYSMLCPWFWFNFNLNLNHRHYCHITLFHHVLPTMAAEAQQWSSRWLFNIAMHNLGRLEKLKPKMHGQLT
jgi:hypothetical protein